MLAEGYWRWAAAGPYRGVPLTNFAGWLLVGALVMVVLEAVLPAGSGRRGPAPLVLYSWTAGAEAFAFAFLFGDPGVAAAGGLAMGALAGAAWLARRRRLARA
jgi:putative membrane protein